MKYAVLFEKTNTGYCAFSPDFDGCVATGATLEETRKHIAEALFIHIAGMREDGDPIPEPSLMELVEPIPEVFEATRQG